MNIGEALEIMGYSDIGEVTKESLSKSFRKLMHRHHPDLFYNEPVKLAENEVIAKRINEAHEKLLNVLSQLESIRQLEKLNHREEILAIIPLSGLWEIYNGGSVKLGSSDGTFNLTKFNIRAHRIYLYIECNILCKGVNYAFSTIKPFITSDEYTIDCVIPVSNLEDADEVRVTTFNKEVNLTLRSTETKLNLRYDNSIKLAIQIKKSVVSESDNERSQTNGTG